MHRSLWGACFLLLFLSSAIGQSWNESKTAGKVQLDLYWFTSVPFIYLDPSGKLTGVEYEIMSDFAAFCKQEYGVEVELNWIEAPSFVSILDMLGTSKRPNQIGVSAFSITEERKKTVKFTESYMPDITVLVSSRNTPIVQTFEEINKMMSNMEAVTIEGTIYENLLLDIKEQLGIDFEITYIHSDRNVLEAISQSQNRFGFIDLPIYLMLIRRGGDLTRQNFFTVRGTGYGFILPQSSDWDEPFNAFLTQYDDTGATARVITKYIGPELYEFYENIYGGGQLGTSILTKEKELQLELIKNANLRLEQELTYKRIFIVGISVTLLFLLVIGILFVHNQRVTRQLRIQKNRIEQQTEDIRHKNEQLLNRNSQLVALNEEKNNLMRILAHDLRSPISQIMMVTEVLNLTKTDLTEDDKKLLSHISDGAMRVNQMISKILDVDAVESNSSMILRENVNVCALIKDLVARYQPVAKEKGISLNLAPCPKNGILNTDHLLLSQVVENLVSNALKFSSAGQEVAVRMERKADTFTIIIHDQGPGFTEDDKRKMYLRFQKLSARPTGDEPSTGLGLSIVKKYVTELGGEIRLETEVGKGSTFQVVLPVSEA